MRPSRARVFINNVKRHHGKQTRRGDKLPYALHPIAVAYLMGQHGFRAEDITVAAYYHDVLEDTAATVETLRNEGVSERSIEIILILTRSECESSEEHFERVLSSGDTDALIVKYFDASHNAIWTEDDKVWNPDWRNEEKKYLDRADRIHAKLVSLGITIPRDNL